MTATIPVTKGKLYWYRLQSQNKANNRPMVTGATSSCPGKPIVDQTDRGPRQYRRWAIQRRHRPQRGRHIVDL